jgi:hypothetical protein
MQWIAAIGIGLAVAGAAAAQEARKDADGLPYNEIKTTPDDVRYVTGGIGVDAQERLNQRADEFNLKLVFTLDEGNYIADVGVAVKDAQGRSVIEDVADGPYFMAKLRPGRYTVSATYEGKTVTRKVQVGERGMRTAYLRWPSNPDTDFIPSDRAAGTQARPSAVGAGGQQR